MGQEKILSVTELSRLITSSLDEAIPFFKVEGEIAQITRASSGHYYFSVKDEFSAMSAVMFRGRAQTLNFEPKQGDKVELSGRLSLFAARGSLQIQVESMRLAGAGSLYEQYLRILASLREEGLFDAERKLPIPAYPRRIGIVTSLQAAALQDVLAALQRRAPLFSVTIYPSLVQGAEAVDSLMHALAQAELRQEVDVILLVRGGGSIEDLWCFNDERLARLIAASSIPIVSGVGHETDTTIADYVADLRAPTPTAAAELVTQTAHALPQLLSGFIQRMQQVITRKVEHSVQRYQELSPRLTRQMERLLLDKAMRFDDLKPRLIAPQRLFDQYELNRQQLEQQLKRNYAELFSHKVGELERLCLRLDARKPNIDKEQERLAHWRERLDRAINQQLLRQHQAFEQYAQLLDSLNPKSVLQRGFSIVYNAEGGVVRAADELHVEQALQLEFASGRAVVKVKSFNQ